MVELGRGQRMCWKKSLGEGNEVQADGSCLSFLPVRVRMPRVTQGSDPALSWGAAPFPQDPNIPQGAKTGKKIPRGRLCVPDPAQTVFGVLGEAQFCLPRGSAGIYTPKPPLDAKWPRSTGPGRAGLSARAALAPKAPSPSGFFRACRWIYGPGCWSSSRLCRGRSAGEGTAGTRKGRGSSRTPGHSGAAAPGGAGTPWRSRPRGAAPRLSRCSEIPSGIPFSPAPKKVVTGTQRPLPLAGCTPKPGTALSQPGSHPASPSRDFPPWECGIPPPGPRQGPAGCLSTSHAALEFSSPSLPPATLRSWFNQLRVFIPCLSLSPFFFLRGQ